MPFMPRWTIVVLCVICGTHLRTSTLASGSSCDCNCGCKPVIKIEEGCCDEKKTAVCEMAPNPAIPMAERQPISGVIRLAQYGSELKLEIEIDMRGVDASSPDSSRPMHVHELADISRDCQDAGPHFDPTGVMDMGDKGMNMDMGSMKPLGDLPTQKVAPDGTIRASFTKDGLSMYGDRCVVGRSIVLHGAHVMGEDGSMKAPKIACCVIRAH